MSRLLFAAAITATGAGHTTVRTIGQLTNRGRCNEKDAIALAKAQAKRDRKAAKRAAQATGGAA